MRILTFIILLCFLHASLAQAQAPKREFRGAWIATYTNIDWPSRSHTPAQQQAALRTILDHHKATGINAVFLQVRSQSDAMYQSPLEPISADLTGLQGRQPNPVWDPLQFALEECRKRGMELHAWLNPYRAVGNVNNLPNFAENHVAKQHPEWLIAAGNLRTLDPGLPAVRNYILKVIADIVERYDLDGIHFDDYFYPSGTFTDDGTFAEHARGFTNRADWRRDNVNLLIKRIHDTINVLKPWVKFGISPSGIYRNSSNPSIGSNTGGMEHYSALFADSKKWLQEGWIDYLAPQVYWYIGQSNANYAVLIPWWNNNAFGRHIYIGLAGYKVNNASQGAPWTDPTQIPDQVRMTRQPAHSNIYGQIFYNTSSMRSTTRLGFRDSLMLNLYRKPALLPTMPWRDATPPAKPTGLIANNFHPDSVSLTWDSPAEGASEFDKFRQYAIYRSESQFVDETDINQLIAITNTAAVGFRYKFTATPYYKNYYYYITALDRFHNESPVSSLAKITLTSIKEAEALSANLSAFPNPFSDQITINVTVESTAPSAIIEIYDLHGKKIQQVHEGKLEALRDYSFTIEANALPPGLFLVRLVSDGRVKSTKVVKR